MERAEGSDACDVSGARYYARGNVFEAIAVAPMASLAAAVVVAAVRPGGSPPDTVAVWVIAAGLYCVYLIFRRRRANWARIQLEAYSASLLEVFQRLGRLRRPWFRSPSFLLLLNLSLAAALILEWDRLYNVTPAFIRPYAIVASVVMALLFVINGARLWSEGSDFARFASGATASVGAGIIGLLIFFATALLVAAPLYLLGAQIFGVDKANWPSWYPLVVMVPTVATSGWVTRAIDPRLRAWGRRGDALRRPAIRDVRARDSRQPLLFLRSFRDDDVQTRVINTATFSLPPARLEEILATEIRQYGPFVGLGAPGSERAAGAARDYHKDEEWRVAVLAHMRDAGAIIVLAGVTQSLHWEMTTLASGGFLSKLIVIFPPRMDGRHAERCAAIHQMLGASQVGRALHQTDLSEAVALYFTATRAPIVVVGRLNTPGEYQAAILTALFGILM